MSIEGPGVFRVRLRRRGAGLPRGVAGAETQHQHPRTLHVPASFGCPWIEAAS